MPKIQNLIFYQPQVEFIKLYFQNRGVRIESDLKKHDLINIYFDPMLAKIIAHDTTREKAIGKLMYALSKLVLLGPVTNIELLKNIISSNSFLCGEYIRISLLTITK